MRAGIWLQRAVVGIALIVCILAVAATVGALLMVQSGHQAMTMGTDSMRPTVNTGDVVIAQKISPSLLEVDDVITFSAPFGSQRLVTHRIVRVEQTPDGPAFATRGDNLAHDDPWLIQYSGNGWKLAYTVPWIGHILGLPRNILGQGIALGVTFLTSLALLWPIVMTSTDSTRSRNSKTPQVRPLKPDCLSTHSKAKRLPVMRPLIPESEIQPGTRQGVSQ